MSEQTNAKKVRTVVGNAAFYTSLFVVVSLLGFGMYRFVAGKLQPLGDLLSEICSTETQHLVVNTFPW